MEIQKSWSWFGIEIGSLEFEIAIENLAFGIAIDFECFLVDGFVRPMK